MKPRLKVKEIRENVFEIIEMNEELRNTDRGDEKLLGRVGDVRIVSAYRPEYVESWSRAQLSTFYLRGTNIEKDNDLLHISPSDRDRFIKAVRLFGGAVKIFGWLWLMPTASPPLEWLLRGERVKTTDEVKATKTTKAVPESPVDDVITEITSNLKDLRSKKEKIAKEIRESVLKLKAAKAARGSWLDVMAKKGKSK